VLQEEVTYKRYNDWQDVLRLVSYHFLEHFPYRQLHMFWRLQGLWQFARGDLAWNRSRGRTSSRFIRARESARALPLRERDDCSIVPGEAS
jgi:hypothetical protein